MSIWSLQQEWIEKDHSHLSFLARNSCFKEIICNFASTCYISHSLFQTTEKQVYQVHKYNNLQIEDVMCVL